jgi:two-component system invasion response regulator UvrY
MFLQINFIMPGNTTMQLAIVDDHRLFRKGLMSLIDLVSDNHTILFEADNGIDLQKKLDPDRQPDIIPVWMGFPA